MGLGEAYHTPPALGVGQLGRSKAKPKGMNKSLLAVQYWETEYRGHFGFLPKARVSCRLTV